MSENWSSYATQLICQLTNAFVRICEQEYMCHAPKLTQFLCFFYSELLEDLERSPHAAAIAECFVERVST